MKDFLVYIIKEIVGKPESVEISENEDEEGRITLTIKASPEDLGRIIGKKGRIIKAIRNLVKIKAIKAKRVVFVEI